jgi:hypothetical protein
VVPVNALRIEQWWLMHNDVDQHTILERNRLTGLTRRIPYHTYTPYLVQRNDRVLLSYLYLHRINKVLLLSTKASQGNCRNRQWIKYSSTSPERNR